MDLICSLVRFRAFPSISSDLIDFLFVTDAAKMASDRCLESDHYRNFLGHPVEKGLLPDSFSHDVVGYGAT